MDWRLLDDMERILASGLREDAREAGVTESTGRVLLALRAGETIPMTELAARLGRSPSTATRFVDRAARGGLVEREAGEDRRERRVRLTPAGLGVRERLEVSRRERAEALPRAVQARTGLGGGEVEWFVGALVDGIRATEASRPLPRAGRAEEQGVTG